MIEAGLDGLHAVQPSCDGMDLAPLKRSLRPTRSSSMAALTSHHVSIRGTPEYRPRRNVRRVLGIMKPGGGYVAGASHDSILEETPVENVLAMFDAIREFGEYGAGN